MNYEKCLEDRNATLHALFGHSNMELSSLPPEGSTISVRGVTDLITTTMPSIPQCDLEKELDNVSNFLKLLISGTKYHSNN